MIAEARGELAGILEPLQWQLHETVPEQIAPPCIVLQPADPFVYVPTDDRTFAGEHVIAFEILLLARLDDEHDNEQASQQLDTMIDAVVGAITPSSWWLDSMGQPAALLTTDWITHGQRVTVAALFTT